MKKIATFSAATLIAIGFAVSGHAQTTTEKVENTVKTDADKTGQTVKKDAKKVGHKTAELASKGKSRLTDKVYKDKVGPGGQTIYIDAHSRYYWVDKRGHRHFVEETDLKDRTDGQ